MFSIHLQACVLTQPIPGHTDPGEQQNSECSVVGECCLLCPTTGIISQPLEEGAQSALSPVGHRLWGQSWLPPLTPQFHLLQCNNQHSYLQCCFLPPLGEFPSLAMGPTAQTVLLKFTICWFSTLEHLLCSWVCSEMYVKHSHRIYGRC